MGNTLNEDTETPTCPERSPYFLSLILTTSAPLIVRESSSPWHLAEYSLTPKPALMSFEPPFAIRLYRILPLDVTSANRMVYKPLLAILNSYQPFSGS